MRIWNGSARISDSSPALRLVVNAAILGLWLWLFRPVYAYLAMISTREEFRTNQVVLIAALTLVIMQIRRGQFRFQPDALPQLYPVALALALGGAALFVLAESNLNINTLSAALFGLASYGLLGLWLHPTKWRQGLPAALLLIGALPFGQHMETFFGYPVRLATARIVGDSLAALGARNLGVETILVFENGISQVDNPCSGVKSLWTGALFFLAATWIERRRVDGRWLLVASLFAASLLAANLARVAILVAVGQVLGLRLLAEMLHLPLGVVGFIAACAGGLALLRYAGRSAESFSPEEEASPVPNRPAWLAPALGFALVLLGVLYNPASQPVRVAALRWSFPQELHTSEWPLTAGEIAWLSGDGVVSGRRYRFDWRGLEGSLLFVASQDWHAQHRPERCFTVYGLEVKSSQPGLAGPDFPLRLLDLGAPGGATLYTAVYWLQSSTQITEEYAARIWDDLTPNPQPWVLVTVLFDQPVNLGSPDALALFSVVRDAADNGLAGSQLP